MVLSYSYAGKQKHFNFIIKVTLVSYKIYVKNITFSHVTSQHFRGSPITIFESLKASLGVKRICFELDCEPCGVSRDEAVKKWCAENDVEWTERVGHTLWDPKHVS